MIATNKRIEYIDALRGFAMILVVFGHIHLFGYEIKSDSSFIFSVISICNMPLFFFLSGFVSYKKDYPWTLRNTYQLAIKKIYHLLVPFSLFSILKAAVEHDNIVTILADPIKNGYWFLLVLCWSYLVYYGLSWLIETRPLLQRYKDIILIISTIIIFLLGYVLKKSNDGPSYLSGVLFTRYFHFFIFGLLARKYNHYFTKIFEEKGVFLLFLSGIVLTILVWDNLNTTATTVLNTTSSWLGIIPVFIIYIPLPYIYLLIIFCIFYKYYNNIRTKGGKFLGFIGERTLDIYMLHYFFIPTLPIYIENPNGIIYITTTLSIAILVIIFSLITGSILRTSNILASLLFGKKINLLPLNNSEISGPYQQS